MKTPVVLVGDLLAIAVVIANQHPKKYDSLMPLTPWNP